MSDSIISTLGAGSGVDITNLVEQLVAAERSGQDAIMDRKEETLNAKLSSYSVLKSSLEELQTAITELSGNDIFNARTVSVPDTDAITANSVDIGAATGTYEIEVVDIARSQSLASVTASSKTSALGYSGDVTINFGTWTYDTGENPVSFSGNGEDSPMTVSITEDDTLQTIADKINGQDSGMQASVIKVDSNYQLLLTSESGASNALEITVSDGSLSAFEFNSTNHSSVTETQQASDAELKVNGLTVYRESNDISDVIDGFNFTINKSSEGDSFSYSIVKDTSSVEDAISSLIETYNSFITTTEELIGYSYNEDNEIVRGDLSGDGSARAMINRLRELVGGTISGTSDPAYSSLASIGITTELDGTLTLDEAQFNSALANNFDAFEDMFALNISSSSTHVDVAAGTYAGNVVAGTYTVEVTQDPTRGQIISTAITQADFDTASDSFTTALDTSAGDYSFTIEINGNVSTTLSLSGTYTTAEELGAAMQELINQDANLKAAGSQVEVAYDPDNDTFAFTSGEYGSMSSVSFSSASADMANLGISTGLTGTAGLDVEGTINGVVGYGYGNVLLADIDSDAYGLNFTVSEGATAAGSFDVSFSRGLAGELSRLIDSYLEENDGTIAMREESIQNQLNDIGEDRDALDSRMEMVYDRYLQQFIAMEAIVSSLQATMDDLDNILNVLPYTASSD